MVSIDGTNISGATIDGQDVQEITVDGDVVWTAGWTESFEDGFSGWNFTSGSSSWANSVSSPSISGNAGEVNTNGEFYTEAFESSASKYPSKGDTFEFWLRFDSDTVDDYPSFRFYFGVQDSENFFSTTISQFYNRLQISERVNDDPTAVYTDIDDVPINFDQWYRVEVEWGDSITVGVYESDGTFLGSLSENYTAFSSGHIGVQVGAEHHVYIDEGKVL
jgi:hypothetical protein